MELMIGEKIKKYRRERDMTQDQLAQALGVSPQSVSKWECADGYPDITLLPGIANYFEVTVDELIGNDEIGQEEDIKKFFSQLEKCDLEDGKKLALEYLRKYPKNYGIINKMIYMLEDDGPVSDDDLPMLREFCEKIIAECTVTSYRDHAIKSMCNNGTEDDFKKWVAMCPADYNNVQSEQLEERLWYRKQWDECRKEHFFVNLNRMLFIINQDGRYTCIPERSELHNGYMLRLIESFGETGEVPEGWLGEYTFLELRYAAAFFGQKKIEEGYAMLDRVFEHTAAGCALPEDKPLPLGCPGLFGDIKYTSLSETAIDAVGNEKRVYITTCSWEQVYAVLNAPSGWEWFNPVRDEPRFKEYLAKAKAMAES